MTLGHPLLQGSKSHARVPSMYQPRVKRVRRSGRLTDKLIRTKCHQIKIYPHLIQTQWVHCQATTQNWKQVDFKVTVREQHVFCLAVKMPMSHSSPGFNSQLCQPQLPTNADIGDRNDGSSNSSCHSCGKPRSHSRLQP